MLSEARFRTHSPVRRRFWVVCEDVPRPSTQRLPTQKAEDMGPIFEVPFGFMVVMKTTGVPQYKTAGLMTECCIVVVKLEDSSDDELSGFVGDSKEVEIYTAALTLHMYLEVHSPGPASMLLDYQSQKDAKFATNTRQELQVPIMLMATAFQCLRAAELFIVRRDTNEGNAQDHANCARS
jgi:hypothetical protein